MTFKNYLFTTLYLLSTCLSGQHDINTTRLDSFLQYLYKEGKASTSVAINVGGNTIYNRSFAVQDIAEGVIKMPTMTVVLELDLLLKPLLHH